MSASGSGRIPARSACSYQAMKCSVMFAYSAESRFMREPA